VELVSEPSVTVTVIVLVPFTFVTVDGRFAAGAIVNVRTEPVPLKVSLPTKPGGTSPLLEAVTIKLLEAVVGEATVNVTLVSVFSGVVTAAIGEIEGPVVTIPRTQPPLTTPVSPAWSSWT